MKYSVIIIENEIESIIYIAGTARRFPRARQQVKKGSAVFPEGSARTGDNFRENGGFGAAFFRISARKNNKSEETSCITAQFVI